VVLGGIEMEKVLSYRNHINCKNCVYYAKGHLCHRHPTFVSREDEEWCGEFKTTQKLLELRARKDRRMCGGR
jgi:hypothetical protein